MHCCVIPRSLPQDLAPAGAQSDKLTLRIEQMVAAELTLKEGLKSLGVFVDECAAYQHADGLIDPFSPLRVELDAQFGHKAKGLAAECMALLDEATSFPVLFDFSVDSLGMEGGYDALWRAGGDACLLLQLASEAYLLSYAVTPYIRFLGALGPVFTEFRMQLLHQIQETAVVMNHVTHSDEFVSNFVEHHKRTMLCTLKQLQYCKQQMQLLMMPGVVITATGIIIPGIISPPQLSRTIARRVNTGPPLVLTHFERAKQRA